MTVYKDRIDAIGRKQNIDRATLAWLLETQEEEALSYLKDSAREVADAVYGNMGRGLIGIVGPTRMDYAKLSARLALFSKGLNRLIAETFFDEDDK